MSAIVIDTNVWISGFLFGGMPEKVLRYCAEASSIRIFRSESLRKEFVRHIYHEKFTERLNKLELDPKRLCRAFLDATVDVEALSLSINDVPLLQDQDDLHVLSLAFAVRADCIITGDKKHLLPLHPFRSIPIITPAQFWKERIHE